ncbi:MAG: AMP-binding protein [Myxococcales bacterium]|nr:AMP-binding protein [Myxococcales bacterium]
MLDQLRLRLKRAEELSRDVLVALDCMAKSLVLRDISLSGMATFAKHLSRLKVGPHVAIHFHAQARPGREALVCGETRLSYKEFDGEIIRLCRALAALGLSSGEAVGLMLPNCAEHLVAQETMPRIGALAVQISYRLKGDEIAHILDNADPQILIYHHSYEREVSLAIQSGEYLEESQLLVVGAPDGLPAYGTRYEELLALQSSELPRARGAGEGGVIIYTSGTTGKPKGATRNWKDTRITSVADMMTQTGMRSDDRHLVVCPLYHSGAQAFTKMMTSVGATIVLADQFDAEQVLRMIEQERITCAFMVPTMLVRINALSDDIKKQYDASSLRWVMSGAAPLATATACAFQDSFGLILHNFYGATETGTVTHATPEDHRARPGSVGLPLRGNELRILGEEGEEIPVGEVGELYVRNSMLISGYYRNPEATQASLRAGFFSVGDLARIDEDGYLYLASRKHDMVISGGVNIYPREIEEVLHGHADIMEAAVIGIPDEEWGESLRAFVVARPKSGILESTVVEHCKERLASYKQPRSVIFLDEMPRNATGKILKRQLRKL